MQKNRVIIIYIYLYPFTNCERQMGENLPRVLEDNSTDVLNTPRRSSGKQQADIWHLLAQDLMKLEILIFSNRKSLLVLKLICLKSSF